MLVELGRMPKDIADTDAAIALEPPDNDTLARACVNRAGALAVLGRLEASLADTTAAIEPGSDNVDVLAPA